MKYEKLGSYLARQTAGEVPMTFAEIEALIGQSLPPSARKHRPWWSNNPANSAITHAWLDAGFRTERVDMGEGKLVFRKIGRQPPPPAPPAAQKSNPLAGLFGALRGTVRLRTEIDLTASVGGEWAAQDDK